MDAFIAAAAAAETQTELASRVAGWQSRIEPALEAQEAQGVSALPKRHAQGS